MGRRGLVLIAACASLLVGCSDSDPAAPDAGGSDSIDLPVRSGEPCAGATRTTPQRVLQQPGVPPYEPVDGGPHVTGGWLCGADVPALAFGAFTAFFEAGWSDIDVPAKWADLADDLGGRLETIDECLVLVVPAGEQGTKPEVMLVRDDTLVRIVGQVDDPVEPLVEAARGFTGRS